MAREILRLLLRGEAGLPFFDLGQGFLLEPVEKVVGLDAQALASRHLEEGSVLFLLRRGVAEFLQAVGGEGDHLIGEMDGLRGLGRKPEGPQPLDDDLLKIGLPGVDDIVDLAGLSEAGDGRAGDVRRYPEGPVAVDSEWLIIEIPAEEAEFPELVGDVLPDVGDRSVGPDDDLLPV